MRTIPLNRIVALVGLICSLILGLLPVIANMDWTSTAGVVAGLFAAAAVVNKWLHGWQLWESSSPHAVAQLRELKADPSDTRTHGDIGENDVSQEAFPNG